MTKSSNILIMFFGSKLEIPILRSLKKSEIVHWKRKLKIKIFILFISLQDFLTKLFSSCLRVTLQE